MSVALFMSPGKCPFLRKIQCNQLKKAIQQVILGKKMSARKRPQRQKKKGGPENMAAGAGDVGLAPTVT